MVQTDLGLVFNSAYRANLAPPLIRTIAGLPRPTIGAKARRPSAIAPSNRAHLSLPTTAKNGRRTDGCAPRPAPTRPGEDGALTLQSQIRQRRA